MKKFTLVICATILWMGASGQNNACNDLFISEMIEGNAPNTTGFLMVEANTFHTSADCPMVDSLSGVTIINDTITIKAVYNLGQMILSKKLIKQ